MKLKTLQIKNFRCFETLEMDLHEQLTVIVAKNGQGKSSILDAIQIDLRSFICEFDLTNSPDYGIDKNDIRIKANKEQMTRELPCEIKLYGYSDIKFLNNMDNIDFLCDYLGLETLPLFLYLEKDGNTNNTHNFLHWELMRFRDNDSQKTKTRNTVDYKIIKDFFNLLQHQIKNENEPISLPVLSYYGTERFWNQKKLIENKRLKKDNDIYMRLFAYRDCLEPESSYKHFSDWFIWLFECYREEQIKQAEKNIPNTIVVNPFSTWAITISVVQQAINDVLKPEIGWYDLEYSVSDEKSLVLYHDQLGKLKLEQLSNGIRAILAMVGDIAYRCIKLNPHLGFNAAKETNGIVMIDEIELHLHPTWQQSILLNLCNAFPNIQFIVTTHSPQVVSTVASEQIRILDNGTVHAAPAGIKGAESERILKQVFGVESRPQNDPNVKLLNEYLDLVYNDKWNEPDTKEMRVILDIIYQGNEPALTAADLHIKNRQLELENKENLD